MVEFFPTTRIRVLSFLNWFCGLVNIMYVTTNDKILDIFRFYSERNVKFSFFLAMLMARVINLKDITFL